MHLEGSCTSRLAQIKTRFRLTLRTVPFRGQSPSWDDAFISGFVLQNMPEQPPAEASSVNCSLFTSVNESVMLACLLKCSWQ